MSIEIERTYILKGKLEDLVNSLHRRFIVLGFAEEEIVYETFKTQQYNLVKDDNTKLRCRVNFDNKKCEMCVKLGTGLSREEYEFVIPASVYNALKSHTIDGYANKTCHVWTFSRHFSDGVTPDYEIEYEFAVSEVNEQFIYLDVEVRWNSKNTDPNILDLRYHAIQNFDIYNYFSPDQVDYEVLKDVELRNENSAGGLNYGRPGQ